jgi:hypothetical protein
MRQKVKRLLFEAYRRNRIADAHERSKRLDQRWLGLGTEAAYRPAIKDGLMTWHDGRMPPRRCMGWLVLTEAGITVMASMEEEFSKAMDDLEQDPAYQRSYLSQYQLVGGLTR